VSKGELMYINLFGDEVNLNGKCISCFNPEAIFVPSLGDCYCADCAEKNETIDTAENHLLDLLEPIVNQWYKHHLARGTEPKLLSGILEVVATYGIENRFQGLILPSKSLQENDAIENYIGG
jgi:hypothetical protein